MAIVRNQRPKLSLSSELNTFVSYTLNVAVRRETFSNSSALCKVKLLLKRSLYISFLVHFVCSLKKAFDFPVPSIFVQYAFLTVQYDFGRKQ